MEKYQVFFTENEAKALKFCIERLHLLGEEVSFNGVDSQQMLNKMSNLVRNIEFDKKTLLADVETCKDEDIKCEHCGSIDVFSFVIGTNEEGRRFELYGCNECHENTLIFKNRVTYE